MADDDKPKGPPAGFGFGKMSPVGEKIMRRQIEGQTKAERDLWVARQIGIKPSSMKRGGTVKKTGLYQLHAGERVVPAQKSGASKRK